MTPNRPHRIETALAKDREKPLEYPLNCYSAFQWKYGVDEGSPWWRKIYFRYVWLPFARFSYCKVRIIPFQRLEPDGTLSWKEQQGVFLCEEDAQREASKYPFGGYSEVAFNAPEPKRTLIGRTHFPASQAALEYERIAANEHTAQVDRFRETLREAQTAIDRFRSRAHHA